MAGSVCCFFFWVGPTLWFQVTRNYLVFDSAAFEISFGKINTDTGTLAFRGSDFVEQLATPGTRQLRELLDAHPTSYVLFVLYMAPFMFAAFIDLKLAWTCFRTARLLDKIVPSDPMKEDTVLHETWVERHRRLGIGVHWTNVQKELSQIRQSGATVAHTSVRAARRSSAFLRDKADSAVGALCTTRSLHG